MTGEGKVLLGIGVITLVLFIGGMFALTKKNEPVVQAPVDESILVREDSEATGAAEPVVTLVEFGDYQCPYCAQASPVIQQLLADYGDQLRFVFRDFPLSQHANAQLAAEAAKAAGAQGKYWEMHSVLYDNQTAWQSAGNAQPLFEQYAQDLELDMDAFSAALNDRTYRTQVQQGMIDGNTLGVSSTPTFFVNGGRFEGSLMDLRLLIEAQLRTLSTEDVAPEATELPE